MRTAIKNSWKVGKVFVLCTVLAACGSEDDPDDVGGDDGGDAIASYSVAGSVIDFETGLEIDGQATVTTSGLSPAPTVSITGAAFTIDGVPPHSVFNVLSGAPPNYRNSYGAAIEVLDDDLANINTEVVSETYLAAMANEFGVALGGGAIVIAQAIDDQGAPRAGVGADAFQVNNATPVSGPFFLDADLRPDAGLAATSASGYAVFFAVEPGLVAINAAPDSGYNMIMASAPTAAATVTISVVQVSDGPAELPQNIDFETQVVPIFTLRGCDACHSGNGIGRDLGNLTLDASANLIFKEVVEEMSPNYGILRVNLASPADSLLLTMPSLEAEPDRHPNVTFASPQDPDYQILRAWIEEGAIR